MNNLTNSLPYVVQYRRKDEGIHWVDMAAFDVEAMADQYCKDCSYNASINPWEYRVDDRSETAGRAEAAEKERDALREALKPFADAANSIEPADHDDWAMWEHPACTDVYVRDFRRARSALQPLEPKND